VIGHRNLINDDNRKWWTLGAMCFALFMFMLDNTVVNVALPSIQRDLGASVGGLEWTVNGYALSFAVLLATGGRLGDIFGRRRVFLVGVVVFAISSATAGLAPSTTALVVSRVVQGVGAALMMPGTLSIITDAFPAHERGKAMGTWAGVSALALALGPVIGGFLSEFVSWRAIFYLNIPVAVGAVLATLFAVRESRDTSVGREVDYAGVAVLTAGLTALVLALVEGNNWGWGSPKVLALVAIAAVALPAFIAIENRVRAPMLRIELLANRNFLGAVTVGLILTFAVMGVYFFLAIYMQNVLQYSALEAGLRFLPLTLMVVALAPVSGWLSDRVGPRWLMAGGLAVLAVAQLIFSRMQVDSSYLALLPGFILMGIGVATTMSPMTSAAMNAISVQKAGIASGVLSMFRMVGGSLGIAITGALFQSQAGHGDFAGIAPEAFVDGLSLAMTVNALVLIIGVVVAITAIRGKGHAESVAASEASLSPGGSAVVAEEAAAAGGR